MKLQYATLKDAFWQDKGYQLPQYDVAAVAAKTQAEPTWLHLGAGNIFRAFLANAQQNLLNQGAADTGIIVAEGFDGEIIHKAYRPFDNLSIFARLKGDRSVDKIVLASVTDALVMDEDFARLQEIAASSSLQMISLTITEKGYQIKDKDKNYYPVVAEDFRAGTDNPKSYIGKIVALLLARYRAGGTPIAMVSMDNMSHNGEKLRHVILKFARNWQENAHVEAAFVDWLSSGKVTFPWSMIDKITPRPDDSVAAMLKADGVEAMDAVITEKKTYVAPFVNAEELEYLVIEDDFPNGRPALDKAGVMFANRDTVNKVETMKVTTCLNPIHTALAIYGCLLGYSSIHEEMKDAQLKALAEAVGYKEGLPVVVNPQILEPKQFIDEVVKVRLPNPFIPDTPQRIASDTSQKLAIRFGETIKSYLASDSLKVEDLVAIPLVFAGWCRYLLGIDDTGNAFECSPDPLLAAAQEKVAGLALGSSDLGNIKELLSDSSIFGVNLYEVGLGEKVEGYVRELLAGTGAVRATLQKYLG